MYIQSFAPRSPVTLSICAPPSALPISFILARLFTVNNLYCDKATPVFRGERCICVCCRQKTSDPCVKYCKSNWYMMNRHVCVHSCLSIRGLCWTLVEQYASTTSAEATACLSTCRRLSAWPSNGCCLDTVAAAPKSPDALLSHQKTVSHGNVSRFNHWVTIFGVHA